MRGRLFVALDLDEPARDLVASAIERVKAAGLVARFTPREKWHVTVAFLGPVAEDARPSLVRLVQDAADRCSPFALALDMIDAFPNRRRPRVVWVGSSRALPGYDACAQAVRTALAGAGFSFDDDAVPHVTVCRLRRSATALPQVTLNGAVMVHVDHLTLYESISAGPSTKYVPLEIAPLGGKLT